MTFGAGRSDSVQAQIKEIVGAESRAHREALLGALTAEDGSNPLVAIQARLGKAMLEAEERHRHEVERLRESHREEARAMHGQMGELRKELARLLEREDADQRVAEEAQRGTAKGRTFEDRVHAAIERIAVARGDCARHVGDERGEGGSKKGDTVVEVGAADGACLGKIVFEDKDDQLSRNAAWNELNAAMAERQADFAVLVVAGEESIPAKREQLLEYEGNKLIVAVDPELPDEMALELAYRYARLRVLMARDRALEVDAAGVRDAAEAARSALSRAQSVRLALTNVDKSSAKAREGSRRLSPTSKPSSRGSRRWWPTRPPRPARGTPTRAAATRSGSSSARARPRASSRAGPRSRSRPRSRPSRARPSCCPCRPAGSRRSPHRSGPREPAPRARSTGSRS